MNFWWTTWSSVLGGVGAGLFFVFCYILLQWFLSATDLTIAYGWGFKEQDDLFLIWPKFEIRNRSRSRSYRLANIAYEADGQPVWFDNDSIWDVVVEPGSIIRVLPGAPVQNISSLDHAFRLQVTVRLQTGRAFWLRGQGPGQQGRSKTQRALFALRKKLESWLVAME